MKVRFIAMLVLALGLAAGSALGANNGSIGIFADTQGANCSVTAPQNGPVNFYCVAILNGLSLGGITGAEYGVTGKPGSFFGNAAKNPNANVFNGDPFDTSPGGGNNIAFPDCQVGPGPILLFSFNGFNGGAAPTGYMSVTPKPTPSNPNFACALVTLCDAPNFTAVCVLAGQGRINAPCTVAAEPSSWSKVKGLYN